MSTHNYQLNDDFTIPKSILIIGSGVFGLSAALELSINPTFIHTKITLVDRLPFPAPDGASIDTSRIVRADYADPAYARLASTAQEFWRAEWGADNRYHETGLCLTAELGQEDYVTASLQNVQHLKSNQDRKRSQAGHGSTEPDIEVLHNKEDIKRVTHTPGASGSHGYINRRSGWVDAEATMRYLRSKVESLGRVTFVTDAVTKLLFSPSHAQVSGVQLLGGSSLLADLTILAAGAWSPALLDLRGIVQATGQVLAYIPLTDAEVRRLSSTPCQLNMSTGMFVIPPPAPEAHIASPVHKYKRLFLKVARHAHGYHNLVEIPHPEEQQQQQQQQQQQHHYNHHSQPASKMMTVSLPSTNPSHLLGGQRVPSEGLEACRNFVRQILLPDEATIADRPFVTARICHYADTPTGDFLLDYHPRYGKTLFVATGGSGHGFKFLPVLGESLVRCLVGDCPDDFKDKWAWRQRVEGEWSTADGTRSGRRGMILEQELSTFSGR